MQSAPGLPEKYNSVDAVQGWDFYEITKLRKRNYIVVILIKKTFILSVVHMYLRIIIIFIIIINILVSSKQEKEMK